MKILLIDNETTLLDELERLIPGKEVVRKWDDLEGLDINSYDIVVLSGGSKFGVKERMQELKPEIDTILSSSKPVIGICFGAELIAEVFGGTLERMERREKGLKEVQVIVDDEVFQGRDTFNAYENHFWKIATAPEEFVTLAKTDKSIAVIKHENLPVWGMQFHPEHFMDKSFADEVFLGIFKKYI